MKLTGRTGIEASRSEGGERASVVRVPGSRGGRMLHAGGRVRSGRGGCERGERRRTDGRYGMMLVVVSADRGGTTAGHHERGACGHRAAGLLERVATVVLMVVRGQRRRRVLQRHGRTAAVRRAGRTPPATVQTDTVRGRLHVYAVPIVVVVVRSVHVVVVHGTGSGRPDGPGVRQQGGHAELDVAGRPGCCHHGRRTAGRIVVVVVNVDVVVQVVQDAGRRAAHDHVGRGGRCAGRHPHGFLVTVVRSGPLLLLLKLLLLLRSVVGGRCRRRWRQQMVER